jgi:hypothetical protein
MYSAVHKVLLATAPNVPVIECLGLEVGVNSHAKIHSSPFHDRLIFKSTARGT